MPALLKQFVLRDDKSASSLWAFLKQNWRALAEQGKPLAISIAEHKAKRSTQQNKRYWAILNDIASNAWIDGKQYSSEAWHEYFKRKFIGCEETPDGGIVGISTTTLSTEEFADYSTKIEEHSLTELGIDF